MKYRFDCRDFNGYKPCRPGWMCEGCKEYKPQGYRILIVNLDALGDVLMTTALLPAIKEKHPESTIRWITYPMAVPLLQNNPLIDEIIPYGTESVHYLQQMKFDLIISCDRDRKSTAITMSTPAVEKRGFGLNEFGVVIPLNPEFEYAYRLGLDDHLKFKVNQQTGQRILAEGMQFDYKVREYIFELTPEEWEHVRAYREVNGLGSNTRVLGVNTGCSAKFPYKKLPFERLVAVLKTLLTRPDTDDLRILLLGGKSETGYNRRIAEAIADNRVIQTPTTEGIRRGMHYIAACDVCLTGDTFGAHAAIALKVPPVIFFTISCESEIEMYGRGEKIVADVPCRPCWRSTCPDAFCMYRIDPDQLVAAVMRTFESLQSGSTRGVARNG